MSQLPSLFQFPETLIQTLNDFSKNRQINPFIPILAVFSTLLFRYTGNENIHLVVAPIEAKGILFRKLEINLTDGTIIHDLISSIHSQVGELDLEKGWKVTSDQEYEIELILSGGILKGQLTRVSGDQLLTTPEQMVGHLIILLTNILSNPSQPLIIYPLLTNDEWEQIIVQWNNTESSYPSKNLCIHQWINLQADRTPDNIAVSDGERSITYRDLCLLANLLAVRLQSEGANPGQYIGIYIEPSIEMVVAMLAVLINGCAFIAFDNSQPRNRINLILEEAGVFLLVTGIISEDDHLFDDHKIIQVDDYSPKNVVLNETKGFQPSREINSEDVCFILFTSGSVGKPKGVLHTHRNIVNRFYSLAKNIPMSESDVFAQSSPISSIDAIDELLFPLFWGASSAIIPEQIVKDPRRLVQTLELVHATHILLVPSLLRMILEISGELEKHLKYLTNWIIGGEPLVTDLAKDFHHKLPGANLFNYYGLTEGDAACFNTSLPHPFCKDPPIGHAAPNVRVYLLNSALQPVPIGVIGEIFIGGNGIARGYLNLPDLNEERFIDDLYFNVPGAKMFRTGDFGRFLPDGNIEYKGRKDFQVKIRGFRVEILEVEEELRKHPSVKEAVVIPWQSANQQTGFDRLVAYIVRDPYQPFSAQELRVFLTSRLPDYAVPAFIIPMDAFPLNPNGKIDRKALPAPQISHSNRELTIILPRDQIEIQLIKIWEEVLGISPIGIQDNFFDLGGDSLSVICFLVQVENLFGKDLPIDIFFQANTIAEFAKILRSNKSQDAWSSLVPIQPFGSKPPLFCVHADGGVLIYRSIAEFLGPDYPVYGLQAQGLDGKKEPIGSVEEIAKHYIREICTVQPHGPYHLGAFSLGGAIIFEMAQQLHSAGEPVGLMAFFDAGSPTYPQFPKTTARLKHKITVHLISLGLKNIREKFSYLWRRSRDRMQVTFFPIIGTILQKLKLKMPHNVRYVVVRKTLNDAVDRYHPGVYPGNITLFRAKYQPEGCIPDPYMGWGKHVSGGINIMEIEGNHNTMMKDKYLRLVAAALRNMID